MVLMSNLDENESKDSNRKDIRTGKSKDDNNQKHADNKNRVKNIPIKKCKKLEI